MTSRRTYTRAVSVSSGSVGTERPRLLNRQKSAVMLITPPVSSPSTQTPPRIMSNPLKLPALDVESQTHISAAGGDMQMQDLVPVVPKLSSKLPDVHAKAVKNTGYCLRLVGDWYSGRKPKPNELRELFNRRLEMVK